MLMILTHIPQPRLTRALIRPIPPTPSDPSLRTPQTEHPPAFLAPKMPHIRATHELAHIARRRATLRRAPPNHGVAGQRLPLGPLQLHDQVPQEARMPLVLVRLEEVVGPIEREQVQDQPPDGRPVRDAVVQDPGVGRGGHRVGLLGEVGDAIADGVAQFFDRQPVRERVQVEQDEVGRLPPRVGRVVGEGPRVQPLGKVLEAGEGLLGQADGLGTGFGKDAAEGGAEEGRAGCQEIFV